MAIKCLQLGHMPALQAEPHNISDEPFVRLTELVCKVVFGAPLMPGHDGSLRRSVQRVYQQRRAVWGGADHPAWLLPHLELIAAGKSWRFAKHVSADERRLTEERFTGARKWQEANGRAPAAALQWVRQEADALDAADRLINDAIGGFYTMLSREVAAARVVLYGCKSVGDGDPVD